MSKSILAAVRECGCAAYPMKMAYVLSKGSKEPVVILQVDYCAVHDLAPRMLKLLRNAPARFPDSAGESAIAFREQIKELLCEVDCVPYTPRPDGRADNKPE